MPSFLLQGAQFPALLAGLWRHRQLISQMTRREVSGRYRGSVLGLFWSLLTPVLMLMVYTFVFSVVFQARWGIAEAENQPQFAVVLFVGLIIHALFAEVINRAPILIVGNVNYVKKVVFPLEILPVVSAAAALFQAMMSLGVLLLVFAVLNGFVHWTLVFMPLLLLPLVCLILGLAWLLASLGVFLRDISQVTGILTMMLLFLAPVFYPVSALPEALRPWMLLNPLTFIIEQSRQVLLLGHAPHWLGLVLYSLVACLIGFAGYAWFQKTRKGFADVL